MHEQAKSGALAGLAGDERAHLGLLLRLTTPGDAASDEATSAQCDDFTRHLVERLSDLRNGSRAIQAGACEWVLGEGPILVYRRSAGGDVVDVVINAGDEAVEVDLLDDDVPVLEPLLLVGDAAASEQTVALGRASAMVARRRARRRLDVAANARILDDGFRRSEAAVRARPTRIDLAITERCNMACRHCISDAPGRTSRGEARTLPAELLDRIRDDLAFAGYVGFVHGGEPLAAPVLFDALDAIREARGGDPAMVHVTTNGTLLGERTAARLAGAGVRSIAVSLGGGTAATHDFLRPAALGLRHVFSVVCENVRAAAILRRRDGLDLRLGISTVVMRQNAGELVALVELAAELGVDWVGFDELVPVSSFAERSLVRVDSGPARDAVAAATDRARALGLVALDLTAAPVVWRCQSPMGASPPSPRPGRLPAGASLLDAREFAERSAIHPCRDPWDRACIEPDGGVRAGDFLGPRLGSVAEASLSSLWIGPIAASVRARSIASRLCGRGPVTCTPG